MQQRFGVAAGLLHPLEDQVQRSAVVAANLLIHCNCSMPCIICVLPAHDHLHAVKAFVGMVCGDAAVVQPLATCWLLTRSVMPNLQWVFGY